MRTEVKTLDTVREYYGRILKSGRDLKTSACSCVDLPLFHQEILEEIHPEIRDKFYGCGSPIPPAVEGCTVLDLGCGTGRDVYVLSKLVGQGGRVLGIDMTDEQLAVASRHIDYQMESFGFGKPNVIFKKGYIEDLSSTGVGDDSVDVVISNCVLNLSSDKRKVFSEIFRVLKPGGELYFSDIFAGRRVPEEYRDDPVLYGECLGGALYIEDFRRILRDTGCLDYRVVSRRAVELENPDIERKVGDVDFYSMTVRAFKLDSLEDICEDYGQVANYLGTIPYYPKRFVLDDHHVFITGKPMLVCGNTASMLEETRYGKHFRVAGDRSVHFGPFDCSPVNVISRGAAGGDRCCG